MDIEITLRDGKLEQVKFPPGVEGYAVVHDIRGGNVDRSVIESESLAAKHEGQQEGRDLIPVSLNVDNLPEEFFQVMEAKGMSCDEKARFLNQLAGWAEEQGGVIQQAVSLAFRDALIAAAVGRPELRDEAIAYWHEQIRRQKS